MPKKIKPKYWEEAKDYLSKKDKKMQSLIEVYDDELYSLGRPFETLARAIVGQQISTKASDAMWLRLKSNFAKNSSALNHENILRAKPLALKEIGLSSQKVQYLKNVAGYFQDREITDSYFRKKDSLEIADELLAIKGIGKWSLEMFQFFYLLEPDIFPLGDIGLIRAIEKHYYLGRKVEKAKILKLSRRWSPWRTVATWYLWRTTDPEPVIY